MPTRSSSKKCLRQNAKHRLRNQQVKSALRTQVKKLRTALTEGNVENAEGLISATVKKIDKSSAKGVLHKNTASRMKSQLARNLNKLKGEKQTV